ncbi:MAG TPA: FAD-dependent monooxygenase [Blastocatellia bacterium]|nr:FAD-dependent monooxygenase [Blastocatellia bacterium]
MKDSAASERAGRARAQANKQHAIVIGASMSGLLAARVLSDHFTRVTLIERDRLPQDQENRQGVPQGRHLHILQTRGEQILSRLFPGLSDDLTQAGAVRIDIGRDLLWFNYGGYSVRFDSGVSQLAMSRPFLESHVRTRVLAIGNVRCREQYDVKGVTANDSRTRVIGVTIQRRAEGSQEESLDADLVVDATGRGSRSPAWLELLGYSKPAESAIRIGYGYTTRIYRQDPGLLPNAKAIYLMPTPPHKKRLGGLFPIERGRWIVTLGGYEGYHAPADEQGFLEHAKKLEAPELYNVISQAEPVSDFVTHRFPSNLRRHYERLTRFPEGYLVVGDAICSFNPIYGQGMSVSAMQVEELDHCLQATSWRNAPERLARSFFKRAARVIDGAWMVTAGEDFSYSGVEGVKPRLTDTINRYIAQVHRTTHDDATAARAFIKVLTLTHPPTTLFNPRVVLQVVRKRLLRPQAKMTAQADADVKAT